MARSKCMKKGLSELVIIMVLLAIAIPVAFIVQSWLTQQAGVLPQVSSVSANIEKKWFNVDTGTTYILVNIRNNGDNPISIIDSYVITPSGALPKVSPVNETLPITIEPKSSKVVLFS
ncbi:MAG: hypothetical protein DRO15_06595, partial [Thermoprotei archaeon]